MLVLATNMQLVTALNIGPLIVSIIFVKNEPENKWVFHCENALTGRVYVGKHHTSTEKMFFELLEVLSEALSVYFEGIHEVETIQEPRTTE